MGWLIALGILTLLAILPVGVHIVYNSDGFLLALLIGPFRIGLIPSKPKDPDKEEKKEAPKEEKKEEKKKDTENKKGGSFLDFWPMVKTGFNFLGSFFRKLRIKDLEMKLTMASSDPCDLAINYGRAWGIMSGLLPLIERIFVIKKRDLDVACDFTASETVIYVRADITIMLGRLLGVVVFYGCKLLWQYFKISNSRKEGSTNESKSSQHVKQHNRKDS